MAQHRTCPECGTKLSSDVSPAGLCPQCLLQLGLDSQSQESDDESWLSALEPEEAETEVPESIGSYRILKLLGEGGMGLVYLAEQEQPVRRQVAVKIIKLGMDTNQVIARFESERQALAMMNHPHIAKVLDAGSTQQGRPYFVMEYVEGIPITEYCDKQCLSTKQRLELFVHVCHAIQHAHQKGIIHRDVKPSNVLVERVDDQAIPKVIDFGVAKAINSRLTEKTLYTQHGMLVGTPTYMSPEQAETGKQGIDTRTDVYSLGVLLYELLVGAPPFEARTLREAGFEEMRRMIREVDPPTLSSRLTGMGETARQVAAQRQAKVKVLESQLRGDLEWITVKALEKEPARRYQSASDLAEEVSRNLADEPVVAGPPSSWYRISKFVKKNRAAVGVLAAFIGLLIVALAVTTFLFLRAEGAREKAEVEAQRVKLEAAAIDAVFLEDYDAYLSRSAEALELHRSVLGNDVDLASYLVRRLAILHLFSLDSSDPQLESLIEDLTKDSLKIVNEALLLGDNRIVETAAILAGNIEERDGDQAAQLYRDMLPLLRQESSQASIFAETAERLARILERRAVHEVRVGNLGSVESLYREALALRYEAHPERNSAIAFTELELGRSLTALGRYEEAENYLLGSYDYFVAEKGQKSAEVQMAVRAIAALYKAAGREKERAYYQKLQPKPIIAAATDLGVISFENVIRSRSGGFSTRFRDHLVCVFGDTDLNASKKARSSTWAWTKDFDAADGLEGFQEILDEFGVPSQLVPFTEDELSFNRENDVKWQLRAGPIVSSPDGSRILLFYSKQLGRFDGRNSGTSLAIWENPAEDRPVRPRLREEGRDPTILFPRPEPALGAAALVDRGYLYAYADEWNQGYCLIKVARAPFDQALDRKAWRSYDGSRWSKDWKDAKVIMGAAPMLSVHWNNYLKKYLAVHSAVWEQAIIRINTADRPEGPWSDSGEIFKELPPEDSDGPTGGGMAHPALARKNGQVEYVTYQRGLGFFENETRLVEIVFQ